ncbi:beta-ketoacyl-[acyl-carrier-protein] synthase family protein [Paenibacillus sp. TRM 82003]|uniref:beta-ketoacyl-[acyl-carrier-protein] synthase family protein n=1 Tax=Kineococcus sp. TRM81007 TaxID=2925831 RepID=UPI001F59506A|nr:beta-ketoacyl-[acyl-carrier-protein] synthase family protein [Kineococcus sp. TRM81007]MCI2237324.1 beta-ketoacyl-[acyl-carrier-protein] synthase family protein [Kineococcus sp. TRM81007]MCI3926569.1 beta-ketoacyl-[acyl-carrier-protein] synthase family protein [Paenibacillus sp. TRM 82003]
MRAPEVVVTGVGTVTPAGNDPEEVWAALLAGDSRAAALDRFDTSAHAVRFGCQVDEPAPHPAVDPKVLRRSDPVTRYALAAALRAHAAAGSPRTDPPRTAVVVGNAVGGRWTSDAESAKFAARGPEGVSPLMPVVSMPNAPAAAISMALGCTGPAHTVATTCASGADAVGWGRALLRAGLADVVVAGGCEATLSPVTLAAFANLDALSRRNDDPAAASRPFDAARDGFVMGEGACFLVLERERDAAARGAAVHGRVLGYGSSVDAHHLSRPHPDGLGARQAVLQALADADVAPAEVGHVSAHGTSTPLNDRLEAHALRAVFGEGAVPPVTALKGVTGHLLGASGALEAAVAARTARTGVVPPVANHRTPDPDVALDVVHGEPRHVPAAPALSNSFGFGGHNACLVLA